MSKGPEQSFAIHRYRDWRQVPRQLQQVLLFAADIPGSALECSIPYADANMMFVRTVLVAMVAANLMAYRIGVHPRQLAWLRSVIAVRLLQRVHKSMR